jgi:hypothetical protein
VLTIRSLTKLKKSNSNQSNMTKKSLIILTSITILIIAIASFSLFNKKNKNSIENTTLSKTVETLEKNANGEFVSTLAEFKVKSETDRFKVSYPRAKFNNEELSKEVKKVLEKTSMITQNQLSVIGAATINENVYFDTTSECGFLEPSSSWCFQLTNDKDTNLVNIVIQKDKFLK